MSKLSISASAMGRANLRNLHWLAWAMAFAAVGAHAQALTQTASLSNDVPFEFDGTSVAVSGGIMVVGGPALTGNSPGVVTVYENFSGTWSAIDTIPSPDAAAVDRFGTSVATDGRTIVVGAPGAYAPGPLSDAGAAYVFSVTPLCTPQGCKGDLYISLAASLYANNPGPGANFGESVAVSGDVVVVGAPNTDSSIANAGEAYVYNRNVDNWGLTTALLPTLLSGAAQYGTFVATDGMHVLVGAPTQLVITGINFSRTQSGEADLYAIQSDGSAVFSGSFNAQNAQSDNAFGSSVAITPSNIAIGASLASTSSAPFVDVFSNNGTGTYNFTKELKSGLAALAPNDGFGSAVALNGTRLAVGAPSEPYVDDPEFGVVYVYDSNAGGSNNWGLTQGLYLGECSISTYVDDNAYIHFGSSVAFNGVTLVGGAPYATLAPAFAVGAAFVFSGDEIFHDGFEVTTPACL